MTHIEAQENPFALFDDWFKEAEEVGDIAYPNAMCLATVDAKNRPSSRMVLLKSHDENGFVFYTNLKSRKGHDLDINPYAALCFYWQSIGKQIRIEGRVEAVTDDEADEYFKTRPRGSQIGAWASKQSQAMEGRYDLEKRVGAYMTKYGLRKVPRPEHWSGFRLIPDYVEYWLEKKYRLHERLVYRKIKFEKMEDWKKEWLFP